MLGILTRNTDQEIETSGVLALFDTAGANPQELRSATPTLNLFTLELPWKNNARDISCIPTGTYTVTKINTPELGNHFAVNDVPGRDLIRIHSANYISQLLGCIAVGLQGGAIAGGDGLTDAESSKVALQQLWDTTTDSWTLVIE